MSRAWQAERAMEREMEALDRQYSAGELTLAEYNEAQRELQRDLRGAYEEDMYDAQQSVRDEWGW